MQNRIIASEVRSISTGHTVQGSASQEDTFVRRLRPGEIHVADERCGSVALWLCGTGSYRRRHSQSMSSTRGGRDQGDTLRRHQNSSSCGKGRQYIAHGVSAVDSVLGLMEQHDLSDASLYPKSEFNALQGGQPQSLAEASEAGALRGHCQQYVRSAGSVFGLNSPCAASIPTRLSTTQSSKTLPYQQETPVRLAA